jgi:hypothetical protein
MILRSRVKRKTRLRENITKVLVKVLDRRLCNLLIIIWLLTESTTHKIRNLLIGRLAVMLLVRSSVGLVATLLTLTDILRCLVAIAGTIAGTVGRLTASSRLG